LEEDTAGDPITGIKWTRKTLRKIAAALKRGGVKVSPSTVGKLMREMHYSLKVNFKRIESNPKTVTPESRKKRNRQFKYISRTRKSFLGENSAIISIDTKKRELIGNFKNNGAVWCREPYCVNAYDFKTLSEGVLIPYGIYDVTKNKGFVVGGISHNTGEFAVNAISKWLSYELKHREEELQSILILADGGSSNGSSNKLWKVSLQEKICNRFEISVTVCHFPPGTSKYNPIEHRLFSEISRNWAGEPLQSYETALKYIRSTKTSTGLTVKAWMDKTSYEKGLKISDDELGMVKIAKHDVLPEWNYTIYPA
jgi:hypothetical protein